jgi:cell division protein FtsA
MDTMAKNQQRYLVGLDIGTSKVAVAIGERKENGTLEVIGVGSAPSRGLRKGVVVNLDATVDSVKHAVEEAELMAGISIERAYVGVAGGHVKGFNCRGVVAVSGRDREVTREDVARVLEAARAVSIPQDRTIFHVLPQEFIVDEQDGIGDPVGMSGTRLEANVHIVTGSVSSIQNTVNCVNRAGIEVIETVLDPIAAAETVLTHDERELGVALVDIGGGTTDLAVFRHGAVAHTTVLPAGGDHFTNDIAVGLRTPIPEAEKIKKKYGCALGTLVADDETIEVPSVGGRKARSLSRRILCEILEPRTEEIFNLVHEDIERAGLRGSVNAGLVLCGGGAILEGVPEVAEQVFDLPVRRGVPTGIAGLVDVVGTPAYSTVVGLLKYGEKRQPDRERAVAAGLFFGRMGGSVRRWLGELF